ncbi:hypothetical protein [Acidovorax sp. SUPP3334]|uniref:hypothetical protein n=1 Tax=Acidovorax sp. SUPP3334 TaxID=2920881 RepID=UPI0023DE2476|nr:hypothetical protein [Acidovorax sp. SUPP3334]GKT27010.1 hypothetical protein AVHM3334_22615 [Acidovorax sp. SUPP3334]
MRRQPTQARARQTIEAIFGATAQIVEKEGEEGVTTNKVAQVAQCQSVNPDWHFFRWELGSAVLDDPGEASFGATRR